MADHVIPPIISVDDHVVEPPDLFEQHLAPEWKDRAPRVVRKKDGTDVWVAKDSDGKVLGYAARDGEQIEAAVWKSVNLNPSSASRSICGVLTFAAP